MLGVADDDELVAADVAAEVRARALAGNRRQHRAQFVVGPEGADAEALGRDLHGAQLHAGALDDIAGEEAEQQTLVPLDGVEQRKHAGQRAGVSGVGAEVVAQVAQVGGDDGVHRRVDLGVGDALEAHRLADDQFVGLAAVAIARGAGGAKGRDERTLHRAATGAVGEQ